MSYYYQYNFVSPEPVYALVKEELRSYFDTNAVDDTLFPLYTDRCLKKLGKGSFKINEAILDIQDFKARLPEDFISVREAWACTSIEQNYQLPSADYNQVSTLSCKLDQEDTFCDPCNGCDNPAIIRAVYKTTRQVAFQTTRKHLLEPGNHNARACCDSRCPNLDVHGCADTFDIRDNKFVTNFRDGVVYLIYYTMEKTEEGYQLIPDNVFIQEYIESYLRYKIFDQLSNIITDETANQIAQKLQKYEAEYYSKKVIAETETKKQTVYQKRDAVLRNMRRNNKYEL